VAGWKKIIHSGSDAHLNDLYLSGDIIHAGDTDTRIQFNTDIINFDTAGSERIRIDAGGNVGIGTATPAYKLDVTGSVRLKDSASEIILDNSTYSEMRYGTANYFRAAGSEAIVNGPIINFKIADSEKMRIHSDGNVGIGTVTPAEKLHINGNLRLGNIKIEDTVGGRIGFNRNTATGTIYNSSISAYQVQNEAGKFEIQSYTGAGGYLGSVFIVSGSVGIGTATPATKLDVNGITTSLGFQTNTANTNYNLLSRNNTANVALYVQKAGSTANEPIADFRYANAGAGQGTSVLKVARGTSYFNNTKLGIGTTTPSHTLTVEGDISASGDLFINNNALIMEQLMLMD